jgi:hypothetical protein
VIVSDFPKPAKPKKVVTSITSPVIQRATPKVGASQDVIRERAFQIYESHDRQHGRDVQDWLRAEDQLLKR